MDESFVVVSVVSGLFGIVGLMILDRNWFRRERFKLERDTLRKENDLRFKRMARDMGLVPPPKSANTSSPGLLETAGSLAPLLKNLAPEQIADLVGVFTGKSSPASREDEAAAFPLNEDGSESPETMDMLLDFAAKNPEITKKILGGFVEGLGEGKEAAHTDLH